jgi:glycosyltransferase involved in cell wall biosynthesis
MSIPKISVAIANYNSANYIEQTLESILNQTFTDFEIVVSDDGSTDNSLEIIKRYQQKDDRIRIVENEHLGNIAGVLNIAHSHSRGDYLCVVDSDDLIRKDCLELCYKFIQENAPEGLIYTDHTIINKDNKHLGPGGRCRLPYDKETLLLNFMTFHFRLFHRNVYEAVGGYHEPASLVWDYDFCLRVSEMAPIKYLNEVMYYYRLHGGQTTQVKSEQIIKYSFITINEAMKRRGIDKDYKLVCQKVKKAGIYVGQFGLMEKGGMIVTKFN